MLQNIREVGRCKIGQMKGRTHNLTNRNRVKERSAGNK